MVKEQFLVLPLSSPNVYVTEVLPTSNEPPGVWVLFRRVTFPELSVAMASEKEIIAKLVGTSTV